MVRPYRGPDDTPAADHSPGSDPNAWHANADALAQWAMDRLVCRTDRLGRYYSDGNGAVRSCAAPADEKDVRPGYLTIAKLRQHFRATDTRHVLGAYTYGPDDTGKHTTIDLDNHDDRPDTAVANERYALHLYSLCADLGFKPLVYESDGKGGFHVRVLFDQPVHARLLRAFGLWLAHDHAEHGITAPPEVFPKNAGGSPFGSFVRLPGRHHKRDVWPRVWTGTEWATDDAAVEHLLSLAGDDPALIPTIAAGFEMPRLTGGSDESRTRPRTPGWVYPWEGYNRNATFEDVADLLERHGWHRVKQSRRDGALGFVRPGKTARDGEGGNLMVVDGVPIFFCFTSGAAPLESWKSHTPAAVFALLEHKGDFRAANKALYDLGYGSRVPDVKIGGGMKGNSPPPADPDDCIVIEALGGIVPKPVQFLVPGLIPAGMLGMLCGQGGEGKSTITLELAAAITTGRCAFGLDYPDPVSGKVLLISCEDDWERTIVPRLAALGADRSKVYRIKGVKKKVLKNGSPAQEMIDFHMGHFAEMQRLLLANPDMRLVAIDPAGAYVGRAGVNENLDADLRAVLGPASETANLTGAAVILVKHLNKSAGVSAVQRVSGSTGYVNACRYVYIIGPDPDDKDRKLMAPVKANVLPSRTAGLAYRLTQLAEGEARGILLKEWPGQIPPGDLTELSKQLFRPAWEGQQTFNPEDIAGMGTHKRQASGSTVEACEQFLRTFLGGYSWPEKEVEDAARTAGHSNNAYWQAKTNMRKGDRNDPQHLSGKPRGQQGPWWVWVGPQSSPSPDRPSPMHQQSHGSEQSQHTQQSQQSQYYNTYNNNKNGETTETADIPQRDTPQRTTSVVSPPVVDLMGKCHRCGNPSGSLYTRTCPACIADEESPPRPRG